jgi:hypothetical protein
MITLGSQELIALNQLIEENLRIGRGQPPVYIDIANNLVRLLSNQNHIVFGRRGSGKSTLLLTTKQKAESRGVLCIYIDSELIKENPFPDVLLSILIKIFEYLLERSRDYERGILRRFRRMPYTKGHSLNREATNIIKDLYRLRTEPEAYELERQTTLTKQGRKGANIKVGLGQAGIGAEIDQATGSTIQETTGATIVKIRCLQQNLEMYQHLLAEMLSKLTQNMMLFLDDFYFIEKQYQPDVIDYLHRLSKGTNMYLKLGTIKYRTSLYRASRVTGRITGVELNNDIFPINLDYTLEDFEMMSNFLDEILSKFAEKANIERGDLDNLFTEGGKDMLHLSSGGVPRDFLNLFVKSQSIAKSHLLEKMEKQRVVGEAARQYLNETKRQNLSEDSVGDSSSLTQMLGRICKFAIETKKKTVFLVDQGESSKAPAEYDRLKQLMDLRFIHLVDSNTSATYGGRKRYEGYMVDAGLWASPRIPGLEEVDFAKVDASGRKDELRNCPKFKLG